MTVLANHRTGLVAMLAAVPDIGIVHDEEPFARTQTEFQAKYLWQPVSGPAQLRGWFVRRATTREQELGIGRVHQVFGWDIQGFMALDPDNDSGKTFDDLVEAIRKAYRDDPTLGGVAEIGPLGQVTGVQVPASGPVMFTGVLCHAARLQLQTHAYLDAGE